MRIAAYDHKMNAVTIFELRHAPNVRHDQIVQVRLIQGALRLAEYGPAPAPDSISEFVALTMTFRFIRIQVFNDVRRELDWWTIAAAGAETSTLLRAIYLDEFWVRPGRAPEKLPKHNRHSLQMELIVQLGREVCS